MKSRAFFKVKRLLYVAAILSIIAQGSTALSQEVGTTSMKSDNSLTKGVSALQFKVNQNFTISSFQGLILSGKRHLTDRSALRIGMNGYIDRRTTDGRDEYYNPVDTTNSVENLELNSVLFEISAQYIYYTSLKSPLHFYWGAGPMISLLRNRAEREIRDLSNNQLTVEDHLGKSWGLGIDCAMGVEWFATRNISFMAEYGFNVNYRWEKDTSEEESSNFYDNTEVVNKNLVASASGVKLGLSLYF